MKTIIKKGLMTIFVSVLAVNGISYATPILIKHKHHHVEKESEQGHYIYRKIWIPPRQNKDGKWTKGRYVYKKVWVPAERHEEPVIVKQHRPEPSPHHHVTPKPPVVVKPSQGPHHHATPLHKPQQPIVVKPMPKPPTPVVVKPAPQIQAGARPAAEVLTNNPTVVKSITPSKASGGMENPHHQQIVEQDANPHHNQ